MNYMNLVLDCGWAVTDVFFEMCVFREDDLTAGNEIRHKKQDVRGRVREPHGHGFDMNLGKWTIQNSCGISKMSSR